MQLNENQRTYFDKIHVHVKSVFDANCFYRT